MTRFDNDWDEDFPGQWWLWEQALSRSINGRRGQEALKDLREALLALPEKRLISGRLADEQGSVCTVGALALHRRMKAGEPRRLVLEQLAELVEADEGGFLSSYEADEATIILGKQVGLTTTIAVHLGAQNDASWKETPEERYERVLAHVEALIL
jgi:hypothetical protein